MHACIYYLMPRIVSLSEDAYEALQRLKRSGDSFSDVVLRVAERERLQRLDELMGSWKMSEPEYGEFMKDLYERRRQSRPRRAES